MVRLAMPAFAPESMSLKTVRTRPHIVSQVPSKVTIREWRRFRRDYKNAEVDKEVGVLKRKRGGVTGGLSLLLSRALYRPFLDYAVAHHARRAPMIDVQK